jgi:cytochrome c553
MRKLISLGLVIFSMVILWACSKDKTTSQNNGVCTTTNMSFNADIQPIFNANCTTCHSGTNSSGSQNLSNYAGVVKAIDNGKLIGVITHASGFPAMPQGAAKLSDCTISKISAWINQGQLNN